MFVMCFLNIALNLNGNNCNFNKNFKIKNYQERPSGKPKDADTQLRMCIELAVKGKEEEWKEQLMIIGDTKNGKFTK